MLEARNYLRSLERSRLARSRTDRPTIFTMYHREWDLLPEVFAPIYSPSTSIAMEFLGLGESPALPRTGSLLEIGCGTGMIAVSAALAGCDRVVAADINPAAVRNAALNAARHGVGDRVAAVHSDLFDQLDGQARFDTIFWSSNYVFAPAGYEYQNTHEYAYVDPGYQAHRRFLAEAPRWLAPGGVILLHFSTRGDLVGLLRAAGECGRGMRLLRDKVIREGELDVDHMLLQVAVINDQVERLCGHY
jgi:release factor glutamine methyltransferase